MSKEKKNDRDIVIKWLYLHGIASYSYKGINRYTWEQLVTIQINNIQRRCERSVITAYQELKSAGVDEMQIFQSCTNLYRIYHPESSITEARLLVSEWIDHHFYSDSQGKTRGCDCPDTSGSLNH